MRNASLGSAWPLRLRALALLVVAAIRPVAAQQTAVLERRLDSLAARLRVAVAAKRAYDDSIRLQTAPFDSVDVGPVRVLTTSELAPAVRASTQQALDDIARRYGAYSDLMADSHMQRRAVLLLGAYRPEADQRPDEELVPVDPDNTRQFADAIEERLMAFIFAHKSHVLTEWIGYKLPLDTGTTTEWALRRIEFASAPTGATQRCFRGDSSSCMDALELRPLADPVLQLFDARSRRAEVERNAYAAAAASRASTERCLAGDDESCVYLMRSFHWYRDSLGWDFRTALAQEAIIVGGHGAFERLIGATGTPAEQLSAAAGVPIEELVSSWQGHLMRARMSSVDITPMIAVVSVGWMGLFAGLGLRSSRWR